MLLATSGLFIGHEDIFGPVIKQIIVWIYGTTFAKNEKEKSEKVKTLAATVSQTNPQLEQQISTEGLHKSHRTIHYKEQIRE